MPRLDFIWGRCVKSRNDEKVQSKAKMWALRTYVGPIMSQSNYMLHSRAATTAEFCADWTDEDNRRALWSFCPPPQFNKCRPLCSHALKFCRAAFAVLPHVNLREELTTRVTRRKSPPIRARSRMAGPVHFSLLMRCLRGARGCWARCMVQLDWPGPVCLLGVVGESGCNLGQGLLHCLAI